MSAFEQAKETMMLLITMFVVIFVSVMFFILLGNYKVGSEVDISNNEVELVALRSLKCLENNEKLSECIKTNKYMIKAVKDGIEIGFVNKKMYEGFGIENKLGELLGLIHEEYFVGKNKYKIIVWFKK